MAVMERETYKGKRYFVAHYRDSSLVFKSYWMPETFGLGSDALSALRAAGIFVGYDDWDELFIDGPFLFQRQARKAASGPVPEPIIDEEAEANREARLRAYDELLITPEFTSVGESKPSDGDEEPVDEEVPAAEATNPASAEEVPDSEGCEPAAAMYDSVTEVLPVIRDDEFEDDGEGQSAGDEEAPESEASEHAAAMYDSVTEVLPVIRGGEFEASDEGAVEPNWVVPADDYYEAGLEAYEEEPSETGWPEGLSDEDYNAIWKEPEDEKPIDGGSRGELDDEEPAEGDSSSELDDGKSADVGLAAEHDDEEPVNGDSSSEHDDEEPKYERLGRHARPS